MKYNVKSLIIGRKKRATGEEYCPCFVAMFSVNDPHIGGKVPDQILDFKEVREIVVKGLNFEYQLEGSDIVIQNLSHVTIDKVSEKDCNVVTITGKQL